MDAQVRRTLLRLGAAYALAWSTTSMAAGPGSAALVSLTGDLSHAGLYVALFYLGAAAGAATGGRAMDALGRRRPLLIAYLIAAVGFVCSGMGVSLGLLPLFIAGVFLSAAAFGTINLTRVSAAEMFAPHERGRGVAWIQISAIFGAVAGPLLLLLSEPLGRLLGRAPLSLVWFIAPPLLLVASALIAGAMEPGDLAREAAGSPASPGRPHADIAPSPESRRLILAAAVSLAASQTAMAVVMGVAGAAVTHAGHGVPVLGGLMFMHFVGMFGLSRLVGSIADSAGRRVTVLTGLALLGVGGAIVAIANNMLGLGIGLLLVGFGWSFGFIGATVLLTDATPAATRARVIGKADLAAQLFSALAATAGGWWFASHGLAGLGVMAVVIAATPVVLLSWVRETTPGTYARAEGVGA